MRKSKKEVADLRKSGAVYWPEMHWWIMPGFDGSMSFLNDKSTMWHTIEPPYQKAAKHFYNESSHHPMWR